MVLAAAYWLVPRKNVVLVFSPALDQHGNSLAGMSLLQDVVDQLELVV